MRHRLLVLGAAALLAAAVGAPTAGAQEPALVGNTIGKNLACAGNNPGVTNFGAPNTVLGAASGQCTGL